MSEPVKPSEQGRASLLKGILNRHAPSATRPATIASFGQERLWVLEQLGGGAPTYNEHIAFRIRGHLDVDRLERSLRRLVDKNAELRAHYKVRGDSIEVVREDEITIALDVAQTDGTSSRDRLEEAERFLNDRLRTPFDLLGGPLFRAHLARVDTTDYLLLLVIHHAVTDASSNVIIAHDLWGAYASPARDGPSSKSPASRATFAEYAAKQRETVSEEFLSTELAEERHRLSGVPSVLELPADHSRPRVLGSTGARIDTALASALFERIRKLAAAEDATPFMVLLASFGALLHRLTSSDSFLIGSPIALRTAPEFVDVVGFCSNTLAIPIDATGDPTFRELLSRVRTATLDALDHQDVPFEKLVTELGGNRDLSRPPLVQVAFSYVASPIPIPPVDELDVQHVVLDSGTSKFELTVGVVAAHDGHHLTAEYSTELFDRETIEDLVRRFQRLLAEVVADPEQPVDAIPLLDPEERERMLHQWNPTIVDPTPITTVIRQFEAQAARTPEATAVVFGDVQCSYQELNRRANFLGHQLKARGVGPEDIVGICIERSLEMVVAVLGVLKSGGAYLPLDPGYPAERLDYMVQDSGARLVLTGAETALSLPSEVELVRVAGANGSDQNPDRSAVGANLAYVIYTSGSTGRPKGVMVEHRNLAAFFAAFDIENEGEQGTWLAMTPLSFDISVLEILWTLTRGLRLIVAAARTAVSARHLQRSLFYFAGSANQAADGYRLLLDGARFADQNGFAAVWVPERHFDPFGGLFPNPSVTAAAIAAVTTRVGIRAGSVVLPLHDPIRVAEEWAVVDNLSGGRVAMSVASGWHTTDFVLAPTAYSNRREALVEQIATLTALWRGASVSRLDGVGNSVDVRVYPSPVQKDLPIWITSAGSIDTFELAGTLGASVLTHLLGQSVEELAHKIDAYRRARAAAGLGGGGHVTLMLHTHLSSSYEDALARIREPFANYLRGSLGLLSRLADGEMGANPANWSAETVDAIVLRGVERYQTEAAWFGTVDSCLPLAQRLQDAGVDEVACLIDFGLDSQEVIDGLPHLVALVDRVNATDPLTFVPEALRREVTHVQLTPSAAYLLAGDPAWMDILRSARSVMIGGEPFPATLSRELASASSATVRNLYGPTEATIWSAAYRISDAESAPPIGQAFASANIYILDSQLEPVPFGVLGEIWIGGPSISRGYSRLASLTAEKFVPDPFGPPGSRLYRTEDIGRRLRDGNVEFVGRRDDQVKLRGYRIELKEVEAVLVENPDVAAAAVIKDGQGPLARLRAFVVTRSGDRDIRNLTAWLKNQLPDHMVPEVVAIERMPLTSSGKVDRNLLGGLGHGPEQVASTSRGPKDLVEELVASIFAELLGRSRVGVEESFFEIGGHSLLAARAIARLEEALGVRIPMLSIFEAPTPMGLADLVNRSSSPPRLPRSQTSHRNGHDSLSSAQGRYHFLERLEPGTALYNEAMGFKIAGSLDVAALRLALRQLSDRHEIFRTAFLETDVDVVATVQSSAFIDLEIQDFSEETRDLKQWLQPLILRPFDLTHAPLGRAALIKLGADQHLLCLVLHHLLGDTWSTMITARDLWALYQANVAARPAELPILDSRFADYAIWERQALAEGGFDNEIAYWKSTLADAPELTVLPTDRPRPAKRTYGGDRVLLAFDPALVSAMRKLAATNSATLFMALLAGFLALIQRTASQSDLVVGTTLANRGDRQLEELVGPFANTLPIRVNVDPAQSFRDLLAAVRRRTLDAFTNQAVPFDSIMRGLGLKRDLSRTSLFQLMFSYHHIAPVPAPTGLSIEAQPLHGGMSKWDLAVSISESETALGGWVEYSTELFDRETIEDLVRRFQRLLAEVVADPEQPVDAIPLLDPEERERMLHQWNPTIVDPTPITTVIRQFEAQAARTPEATAVVFGDVQCSYQELNRRANFLGHQLKARGVGPEDIVGICIERSLEMVVAVLGVLKSGGAYLPLDPGYPAERLDYMVQDSGARLVLTGAETALSLPSEVELVRVAGANGSDQNPDRSAVGANLAYVIYTSGSTGRPKGVMVEHRNLADYVSSITTVLGISERTRFGLLQPLAFDFGVTAIWPTLVAGGTVHILDAERVLDSRELTKYFRDHQITHLKIAPTHLAALVEGAAGPPSLPLEVLVVGGESSDWQWLKDTCDQRPGMSLFNHYGPTETTVGVLVANLTRVHPDRKATPLGHPLPTACAYILDQSLEPTPVGVPGELYVGGSQLSRGYLANARLTGASFVPDPFASIPGGRLYRTGDLARRLSGGRIEYVGRSDQQVKIRGNRVELGEVATELGRHDSVAACSVQSHEGELIAYVVSRPGRALNESELRRSLAKRLPAFMIPGRIVLTDSLPIKGHGKVDASALHELTHAQEVPPVRATEGPTIPTRSGTSPVLGLAADVLGVASVGPDDNFFDRGGHSLLAIRLVSRIRAKLGVDIAVREVFDSETLGALSNRVESAIESVGSITDLQSRLLMVETLTDEQVVEALKDLQ